MDETLDDAPSKQLLFAIFFFGSSLFLFFAFVFLKFSLFLGLVIFSEVESPVGDEAVGWMFD